MIKAVCFDLDGMFFTQESFQKFKKALPTHHEIQDLDHVFHKSDEMVLFKLGKLSEQEYWEYMCNELSIDLTDEEIFKILRDSYDVNEKVRGFVKKIRAKGYLSCLCSNNFVTRVRELDKKFDFLKDFDVKVFSYEVGSVKPEKAIFEELLKRTNVKPDQIVYSDDNAERLSGAKEISIKTVVFKNFEQFVEDLKELGIEV
jgi:putative hydrolase of the HAD superfamily